MAYEICVYLLNYVSEKKVRKDFSIQKNPILHRAELQLSFFGHPVYEFFFYSAFEYVYRYTLKKRYPIRRYGLAAQGNPSALPIDYNSAPNVRVAFAKRNYTQGLYFQLPRKGKGSEIFSCTGWSINISSSLGFLHFFFKFVLSCQRWKETFCIN